MLNLTDELLQDLSNELNFDEIKTFTLKELSPKDNNKILNVLYAKKEQMNNILSTVVNCVITQNQSSLILTRTSLLNILKLDTNHDTDGFKSDKYPLIVKQLSKFFTVTKIKNKKREVMILTLSNPKLLKVLEIDSTKLETEFKSVKNYVLGERTNSNQYNSVEELFADLKAKEVVPEPVVKYKHSFKRPTDNKPIVPLKDEVATTLPVDTKETLKNEIRAVLEPKRAELNANDQELPEITNYEYVAITNYVISNNISIESLGMTYDNVSGNIRDLFEYYNLKKEVDLSKLTTYNVLSA